MSNVILTPTAVTREIQRVLHEKATFLKTVNRQYDDSFAVAGAKIGSQLKIRLPNQYKVRTGKAIDVQDTDETSVTLTVATQKGVDMSFSTAELTLDLQDFSDRIIEPAVAVLVSDIENDALQNMTKDVYNSVGTAGTTPAGMLVFGQARAKLNQYLAPKDKKRHVQLDSIAMATMVNAYNGLFQDQTAIKNQYLDGFIGRNSGLNWYEQEKIYRHTTGDDVAGTIDDAAGANLVEGTTTLHMDALGTTVTAGSVFTIAGVLAVHPETKVAYSHEQQFVVVGTPTIASNEGDITISPAIYTSATPAKQNVDHMPSDGDVVTFVGSASTEYEQHLVYHEDAFAFATADLEMPNGVDFKAREVLDGITIRLLRQYDINNDNIPARLDIIYGYKTIRAQLATRITG